MILEKVTLINGEFVTSKESSPHYITVKQVHGNKIAHISEAKEQKIEADGLYWKQGEISAHAIPCIYTADCLPIYLEGTLGCALLHAGWRGIKSKIHLNPILNNLRITKAHIGPCISTEKFEVSAEFYDEFPRSPHFKTKGDKVFFDLKAQVETDLKMNWPDMKITKSEVCTFKNLAYNSFRRTKKPDRNYNFILTSSNSY